jgi:SAM-dependent methyltransferase
LEQGTQEVSFSKRLKKRVALRSRFSKLDYFYSLCDSNASILDVGVSSYEHSDQVNLFLRNFRLSSGQYTGLAIQPMDEMRSKYPGKKFVEYSGTIFPFAKREFDWVFSNAVIEHVGGRDDQLQFVNEMLRVGMNVFFTTPNKYFPIESHTNVVFKHWFKSSFYSWCKRKRPFWRVENLLLLSFYDLHEIMKSSNAKVFKIRKNRFAGWPMTFTVVCSEVEH